MLGLPLTDAQPLKGFDGTRPTDTPVREHWVGRVQVPVNETDPVLREEVDD